MKRLVTLFGILTVIGLAVITLASQATGVTPTVLARGTYEGFKVRSAQEGGIDFKAESKNAVDMVVREHVYAPGGSTGWHTHPGPVFISVKQGTLTFYEYDDPTCTPHTVSAPYGYVDTGRGHLARNETGVTAVDVTVIIAPVAGSFRGELDPTGYCSGF
jgi:hypothetical protein